MPKMKDPKTFPARRIAARMIKDLKGVCPGVHSMAIGREEKIPEILSQAGIG